MEDGMRLKDVDGPIVVSSRTLNIHNNGLDREFNRNAGIGDKLSNTTLINSKVWVNDYTTSLTSDNGNYNLTSLQTQDFNFICQQPSSPDDSLVDDDEGLNSGSSSSDSSPEAEYRSISQTSDSDSEDINLPTNKGRGIVNPNYPGFQHFASQLHSPYTDSEEDSVSLNNNNNEVIESVNQLDTVGSFQKSFYDKPKFNIPLDPDKVNVNSVEVASEIVKDLNIPGAKSEADSFDKDLCLKLENLEKERSSSEMNANLSKDSSKENNNKMADAFLSGIKEEVQKCEVKDANHNAGTETDQVYCDNEDPVVPRKKEKMEINLNLKKNREQPANLISQQAPANMPNRQTVPARNMSNRRLMSKDKNRHTEKLGSFDVYNIETAMPTIDLDAIESHLKAAREEERRRRNDREEIRRRLASGCDTDEYYGGERPGRKPSLQARLQSGMNLQICFMNDTMSDNESPSTEVEPSQVNKSPVKYPAPATEILRTEQKPLQPHTNTSLNKSIRGGLSLPLNQNNEFQTEADFFMKQARLQAEARVALAQAKDMARLQMEVERQRKQASPITDMLRQTLQKVGIVFPQDRRRVSRQMLTDMNLAQLQVIVNDLHTQIEYLNESLVKYLMERDDLHMSQDSMLVDIEDLTRYLGAKENTFKDDFSQNNNILLTKPKINRIAGLMRK